MILLPEADVHGQAGIYLVYFKRPEVLLSAYTQVKKKTVCSAFSALLFLVISYLIKNTDTFSQGITFESVASNRTWQRNFRKEKWKITVRNLKIA